MALWRMIVWAAAALVIVLAMVNLGFKLYLARGMRSDSESRRRHRGRLSLPARHAARDGSARLAFGARKPSHATPYAFESLTPSALHEVLDGIDTVDCIDSGGTMLVWLLDQHPA
jgi:hypothetical protein